MKVINIGLDSLTLDPKSVVASRNRAYGEMTEQYSVLSPAKETVIVPLSEKTTAFGFGGKNKAVQLWSIYRKAASLVKAGMGDVVTTQDTYFLGLLGVILREQYNCALEVQVLGIEKLSFHRRLLLQFVLKRADSIRVLSPRLLKRLVSEFGIKEDRMVLVPIYVDVSTLGFTVSTTDTHLAQEVAIQNELFQKEYAHRFNIVSVNRLVPIKNISMQLQAIETLCTKFPNILLHIVGDGPLETQLKEEIEDRSLGDHVILHGYKSGTQLSPFFTQSDCFVLTSDFEGYGMVIVEAATAGLPIVMTDVGCAGDVVVNEKSAVIVPPKDVNAFTYALERLIEDSSLRGRLKKEAFLSVANLPSFADVLDKYKASWEHALENKR